MLLIVVLTLALPRCGRDQEPKPIGDPIPVPPSPTEPEGLLRWAARRADGDLHSFAAWSSTALRSAPSQINQPLSECGHDVGYECKPGKPAPADGWCSGAHEHATGWLACLTWKLGEPGVGAIEYDSYASHPVPCSVFGGVSMGAPHADPATGWETRVCQLEHAQVIIRQMPSGEHAARTRINVYDDRFIELEPLTARLLEHAKRNAGLD